MTNVWQVQVAAPTEEAATRLARGAVEAKLASGGQVIGPLISVFWHLGEFGRARSGRLSSRPLLIATPSLRNTSSSGMSGQTLRSQRFPWQPG